MHIEVAANTTLAILIKEVILGTIGNTDPLIAVRRLTLTVLQAASTKDTGLLLAANCVASTYSL
jgi:hypothetical protein